MSLTTLNAVKAWLNVTSTDDDVLLTRLINQVSGATLNYLSRPSITRQTYTELRDGVGNERLVLRNWPVIQINNLAVGAQSIPAATTLSASGYTLATWDGTSAGLPQEITLRGYCFHRGRSNIQIGYEAGYCVQGQAATIPASPYQITITPAGGSWSQDDGVAYANGNEFAKVSGSPAVGQYSVIADGNGNGVYTFAAADTNQSILLSYSFIPADLEQAVIEWIGERYRYKDRIGQTTRGLGGQETAGYSLKGIPDYISVVFDNYAKFLPL